MRSLAWLLLLSCLAACGATAPADDEPRVFTEQVTGPANLIADYFVAVANLDRAAALALGTAEWAERENDWGGSFTRAFFDEGIKFSSWELQGIEPQEDGTVKARVRAALYEAGGESDQEPMTFTLREDADGWVILDLR